MRTREFAQAAIRCTLLGLMVSTAACSPAAQEQQAAAAGQPAAKADEALPLTLENIYKRGRGGASNPAISPDGNWVTFAARSAKGQGIHRLSMKGGGGGDPQFWSEGSDAVWAPDSRSIVVVRGDRLHRTGLDETPAKPLTEAIKGLRAPVFSPDGRSIAFYSTSSGHQDIWLTTADGGAPRQLTRESMSEDDGRFSPAWSPDGKTIAFISNKANYWDDDLWVVDVATGAAKQLSRGVTAIGPSPLWSPRGDRIAVLGDSKKDYWYLDLTDIFLIDAKTGAESKVTMPLYVTSYNQPRSGRLTGSASISPTRNVANITSGRGQGPAACRPGQQHRWCAEQARHYARHRCVRLCAHNETEGSEIDDLPAIGGQARRRRTWPRSGKGCANRRKSLKSFDGLYTQGSSICLQPSRDSAVRRLFRCTAGARTGACAVRT